MKKAVYIHNDKVYDIEWYQVDLLLAAGLMKIVKFILDRRPTPTPAETREFRRAVKLAIPPEKKTRRIKYAIKDLKSAIFG